MPDPTTVPVDLSPGAILLRAGAIIETNGWHQGDYCEPRPGVDPRDCPVCSLGSINLACGLVPDAPNGPTDRSAWVASMAAANVLLEHLMETADDPGDVGTWNDDPDREAAEVVAALRAAAESAVTHA